jgi:hypothetical protein
MPENLLPPPVNIDSLKRISGTRHMPLLKYALPAVMYAAVCAWMLSDESKKPHPDYQMLAITLAIFGVILAVVFKRRMWGLADEVLDGGDYLVIRRGKREARVELTNVSDVCVNSGPPTKVTLQLRLPSELGAKVSFLPNPTSRNPLATSSIPEDLVRRVQQLDKRRAR